MQMAPVTPTAAIRHGPTDDAALAELHDTFERLRRRHARLSRVVRQKVAEADELVRRSRGKSSVALARDRVGYHDVWARWSESHREVAAAADSLLRARPSSVAHLVMIFGALEWVLLADGVIVDQAAERDVRRFGGSLRELAAGRESSSVLTALAMFSMLLFSSW